MTAEEAIKILRELLSMTINDGGERGGMAVQMAVNALQNQQDSLPAEFPDVAEKEARKRYRSIPSCGQFGTGDYEPAEDNEADRRIFIEGAMFGAGWIIGRNNSQKGK